MGSLCEGVARTLTGGGKIDEMEGSRGLIKEFVRWGEMGWMKKKKKGTIALLCLAYSRRRSSRLQVGHSSRVPLAIAGAPRMILDSTHRKLWERMRK